jgi:hypothetical protein
MRDLSRLLPLAMLGLAACSSVEWRARPTEDQWQGRSLWCAKHVTVAALDGDAAEQGVEIWERIRAAFVAVGEPPPTAPLLVVLGSAEQLLPGDPEQSMPSFEAWRREFASEDGMHFGPGAGAPPDASPELVAAMFRVMPAAFPLEAADLAMPATWQRTSTWGMVMPSDATIVAVAEEMLDAEMVKANIGFGKRLLLAPLLPWIRGMMREIFRELRVRQLVDASCSPRVRGKPFSPKLRDALLAQLGLKPNMQPVQPPPSMSQAVEQGQAGTDLAPEK